MDKNFSVGQKTGTTANTDQYHDLISWHTDNDCKLALFYLNVCLISQSSVPILYINLLFLMFSGSCQVLTICKAVQGV